MVLHIAPRLPGWLKPTSITEIENVPLGSGMSIRSPKSVTPTLIFKVICNPSRVADLVQEEEVAPFFSIVHDKRSLSDVMLMLEMKNQRFQLFAVLTVDAHRHTVPFDSDRQGNHRINRYGVVGIVSRTLQSSCGVSLTRHRSIVKQSPCCGRSHW